MRVIGSDHGSAAGEVHVLDHAAVVGLAEEAGERAEGADREHLEVGLGADVERYWGRLFALSARACASAPFDLAVDRACRREAR